MAKAVIDTEHYFRQKKYVKSHKVRVNTIDRAEHRRNLQDDSASMFVSSFYLEYAQETRHITVRKPAKCVLGGERRVERQ